jgi:hypothetical protein
MAVEASNETLTVLNNLEGVVKSVDSIMKIVGEVANVSA